MTSPLFEHVSHCGWGVITHLKLRSLRSRNELQQRPPMGHNYSLYRLSGLSKGPKHSPLLSTFQFMSLVNIATKYRFSAPGLVALTWHELVGEWIVHKTHHHKKRIWRRCAGAVEDQHQQFLTSSKPLLDSHLIVHFKHKGEVKNCELEPSLTDHGLRLHDVSEGSAKDTSA